MIFNFFINIPEMFTGSLSIHNTTSRHRIIPTGVEWVTSQYPPNCHQTAFDGAILIHSLIAVMRTGRIKPTGIGGQARRDELLIPSNQKQQNPSRDIPDR
jgi:hypothetical protein